MEIKMIDLDKSENIVKPDRSSIVEKEITPSKNMFNKQNIIVVVTFVIVAVAGFYTGSYIKTSASGGLIGSADLKNIQADIPEAGVKVGDIYGSADEKAFRDSATGVLDKGGFNGEGTHKIVRPGGATQTVYITSSVIDLDMLVGHQITAWGETFKGQKVSWLMDVGRAKVENLNMPLPK